MKFSVPNVYQEYTCVCICLQLLICVYTHTYTKNKIQESTCFVRLEHKLQLTSTACPSYLKGYLLHMNNGRFKTSTINPQKTLTMRSINKNKALVSLLALIFLHLFITSLFSSYHGRHNFPRKILSQSRRLLVSVNSFSADPNKLRGEMKEKGKIEKSFEDSLRKRPPSSSNPIQNK